jgi:cytoskeletal protein RodZ
MGAVEAVRAQTLRDKRASATPLSVEADPRPKAESEGPTLGTFLVGARERRGVSRDDAVRETRIPDHYVQMMESNDYSMISDQLYVLPFLRRYATFLALDPEETVMRFVREVQRADNVPPVRSIEPIEMDRPRAGGRRRSWNRPAIAVAVIAGLLAAWLAESRYRHAGAETPVAKAATDQNASTR